jgi:hypothetical protein
MVIFHSYVNVYQRIPSGKGERLVTSGFQQVEWSSSELPDDSLNDAILLIGSKIQWDEWNLKSKYLKGHSHREV